MWGGEAHCSSPGCPWGAAACPHFQVHFPGAYHETVWRGSSITGWEEAACPLFSMVFQLTDEHGLLLDTKNLLGFGCSGKGANRFLEPYFFWK